MSGKWDEILSEKCQFISKRKEEKIPTHFADAKSAREWKLTIESSPRSESLVSIPCKLLALRSNFSPHPEILGKRNSEKY